MTATSDDAQTLFRLFNEIGIIAQLSGNAFQKVLPGAMTLPQFVVLNHLSRLGGNRTPLQIANAMQVSKGAMTNTLGHLDRAGLISIVPDGKDGRSKRVDISQAGRNARDSAVEAMKPELLVMAETFPQDEILKILPLLEAMRKMLDERRN